jgi:hypothetical protein
LEGGVLHTMLMDENHRPSHTITREAIIKRLVLFHSLSLAHSFCQLNQWDDIKYSLGILALSAGLECSNIDLVIQSMKCIHKDLELQGNQLIAAYVKK